VETNRRTCENRGTEKFKSVQRLRCPSRAEQSPSRISRRKKRDRNCKTAGTSQCASPFPLSMASPTQGSLPQRKPSALLHENPARTLGRRAAGHQNECHRPRTASPAHPAAAGTPTPGQCSQGQGQEQGKRTRPLRSLLSPRTAPPSQRRLEEPQGSHREPLF